MSSAAGSPREDGGTTPEAPESPAVTVHAQTATAAAGGPAPGNED